MRKLSYWIAEHLEDSIGYSIRARTRRECEVKRNAEGPEGAIRFAKPVKVVVPYDTLLELVENVVGEGGERMYFTKEPQRGEEDED